jgi:hypothetical protein
MRIWIGFITFAILGFPAAYAQTPPVPQLRRRMLDYASFNARSVCLLRLSRVGRRQWQRHLQRGLMQRKTSIGSAP